MQTAADKGQRYTYADYCAWDGSQRWELIDGAAYAMSPGPSWKHQMIVGNLYFQLAGFLQGKPCMAFVAPLDVRLNAEDGDDTVVQPDILVICDRSKLSGTCCVGAPDMVVEILSPSTASNDMFLKYSKYLQAGVREYWIADPETKTVRAFILKDGKYDSVDYFGSGAVPVHVLEGCEIDLTRVFDF